ncbi:MAPK/ERK kinase kinase 1 [Fagus crenata]
MMDVELLVSRAERCGEPIRKQVEGWLRRAKIKVTEAQELCDEEPNLNPKGRRMSFKYVTKNLGLLHWKSANMERIAREMGVIMREKNFESVSLPLSPSASGARFGGDEDLPGGGGSKVGKRNTMDSSSTNTEPKSNIPPYERFKRSMTHWQRVEQLGRGSFGTVYKGMSNYGFFFAVKEASLLDQGSQGKQKVSCLEQDESKIYIFLELVTQGSLAKLYERHHLEDSQVSEYTRQILNGLKYLHDQNVIHRDIKCANILVEANGTVKLADFGLAKAIKSNDVKSCKGTPSWMAPEVINKKYGGYGLPADIWSLGCTVLEMSNRNIPYSDMNVMAAMFKIGKGEAPHVPKSLPKDARNFILWCLQANPEDRPTAAELLDHPFIKRSLILCWEWLILCVVNLVS